MVVRDDEVTDNSIVRRGGLGGLESAESTPARRAAASG